MTAWKMVPVDYTTGQMKAALEAAKEAKPRASARDVKAHAFDLCTGYRVMVAAAPPAESSASIRNAALEEAWTICMRLAKSDVPGSVCAAEIRKLMEQGNEG